MKGAVVALLVENMNTLALPPMPEVPRPETAIDMVETLQDTNIEDLNEYSEIVIDGLKAQVQMVADPYINVRYFDAPGAPKGLRLIQSGRVAIQKIVYTPAIEQV